MQKIFITYFFTIIFFNLLNRHETTQQPNSNDQLGNEVKLPEMVPPAKQQQEETVMVVVIDAGTIDCFYQSIYNPKHTEFEIDYQVVEGGENDITFVIKAPSGAIIVNEMKSTEGSHKIKISDPNHGYGDYGICFDNSFSYTTSKKVFFELFLLDKDGNYLNDYDIKTILNDQKDGLGSQLHHFNSITNKIKANLNEIERMQSYYRAVEAIDRLTMEKNYKMVTWFGYFSMAGLIVAALIQVFTIRCLFIEQSKVGKFIRRGKFSD